MAYMKFKPLCLFADAILFTAFYDILSLEMLPKINCEGSREMVQWLRAFVALEDDL